MVGVQVVHRDARDNEDIAASCGPPTRRTGRSPALELIVSLPRRKGCDFVLPGRGGNTSFGGLPRLWRALAAKAKLEGITLHGLRHSFASVAGDLGYSEATIGAMIGHSSGTMTSRYVHHLDAVLIAAADRVAEAVAGFMGSRLMSAASQ